MHKEKIKKKGTIRCARYIKVRWSNSLYTSPAASYLYLCNAQHANLVRRRVVLISKLKVYETKYTFIATLQLFENPNEGII